MFVNLVVSDVWDFVHVCVYVYTYIHMHKILEVTYNQISYYIYINKLNAWLTRFNRKLHLHELQANQKLHKEELMLD